MQQHIVRPWLHVCNLDLLWLRHVCCTPCCSSLLLVALAAARSRLLPTSCHKQQQAQQQLYNFHTNNTPPAAWQAPRPHAAGRGPTLHDPHKPRATIPQTWMLPQHSTAHRYNSTPCAPAVPNTGARGTIHTACEKRGAGRRVCRVPPACIQPHRCNQSHRPPGDSQYLEGVKKGLSSSHSAADGG